MEVPKPQTPPDPEASTNLEKAVLEKGWATPEQLAAAVAHQAEKKSQGETVSLSQALVTLGTLTATQVRQLLGAQEKVSMLCPACRKTFNIYGKAGARTLCPKCKTPLVPAMTSTPAAATASAPIAATSSTPVPSAPAEPQAAPAAPAVPVSIPLSIPVAEVAAPPAEALDPALVDLIAGYRIVKRLGSGGMGDVYRAQQTSLDRPVALKILPAELAKNQEFVQRFTSEARAAAKVMHENIVAAVDVGESNGRFYFVMELIEGLTVQQTVQREGPLAEDRALNIARQIACGLRHAYQQHLIHRDIKPANIMLAANNVAKICDFGLARDLNTDVTLTMPGLVQSSPAYASPEQCRGRRDLDHRTDMYSLGVTLFEMLTGKRPFNAETPGALFIKHATEAPPSPQSVNPSVSPAVSQLVLRLLKKEPSQRFDTYDQLIQAIETAQKHKKLPAAKPVRPGTLRRTVASRNPMIIGSAAAVLLLGAAGFLFFRSGGDAGKKPPPGAEAKTPRADPEAERLAAAVTHLEKKTEDDPSEIPAVRERWKILAEKYRGTPASAMIARRQSDFEAKVAAMADALAAQTVGEAEARRQAGRPAESLVLLRGFPKGFDGTDAGTRIATLAGDVEKFVDDLYRREREKILVLLAGGKAEEAFRALTPLKVLVSGPNAEGKTDFIRADYRDEFEKLTARIEEVAKGDRPKPETSKTTPEADLAPAKTAERGIVAVPDYVQVLKAPATRSNPQERARAAAAFHGLAPRSALCRAAEVFLAHDDRFWKLGGDRLKLKTDKVELDLEGQAVVDDAKKTTTFQANNGQKAVLQADGKVALNGGAWITPLKVELIRNQTTALSKAFGEYLAALPLERADTISSAEHQSSFVTLARKIAELGETPKEVLYLFAMAHADELIGQNLRPDAESARLAKLQSAKASDYLGPAASVNRVALARAIAAGSAPAELKRATDAVSTVVEFPTRYLTALAYFLDKEFDPTAAAGAWKRLGAMAPETPGCKYSDEVAERLKKALVCDSCTGQGKYACKKCLAQGMADCDRCKGTGRVKENPDSTSAFAYTVPCPICKQKGKITCPTCQGGRIQKCEKCEGKKVKKSMVSADWADVLSSYLCLSCGGAGSVFARTGYPCPDCDGFGRFPTNASAMAPVRPPPPPVVREAPSATPSPAAASPASADAGGLQPGLTAQCFTGERFETLGHTRVDPAIDFKWNMEGAPPAAWPGGPGEHFSIRWTGWIRVNESGKHFFKAMSDDGVRLFVDDVQLFEDWDPHAPRQVSALVELTKGQHKIRVEYYNSGLGGMVSLSWQPPSASSLALIPAEAFRCPKK